MKNTILSIVALLAATAAPAQSISDVLRSVEENNVELKAARKGNEAAYLEVKQENNLEGLSVEYSPFFNGDVGGIASSELVVSQGFDFPTLYGARKKAGRLQRDVLDMEYQAARRDVMLQAKNFCLDLVFLEKQKAVLDERRRNSDELLATFTEKYTNGEATSLELNNIKMERMNLDRELVEAETARTAALSGLQALNGGKEITLTETEYPAVPTDGYGALYERAVAADRSVMTAQAAVRAAEQDVKVNRQGWLPKLEVGYRRNTDVDDASHGFLIGGSIPLFANKNKVKSAKARHAEAQMKQADARIKAESSARELIDKMRQLRAAADSYDLPLMHETLRLLRTAVDNGEMSVIDYYSAADEVYVNIQSYLDIERQYHGVVADVMKNEL